MNTRKAVGALCAIAATLGMLAGGGVAWADDGATASARAIDEGGGRWTLEHTLEWAANMTSGTMPVEQTILVSYDTSADADAVRALIGRLAPLAGNARNRLCVAGDDGDDFECADGADHEFEIRTGGAADHAGGWERLFDQAAKEEGVVTVIQTGAAYGAGAWDADRYASLAGQAGAKTDDYIIALPGASDEGAAAARACAEAVGARYVDGGDDAAVEAVLDTVGSRWETTWHSNFTAPTGLSFRLTDHVAPDWTTFSRDDVTLAYADGSEVADGWTASWDAASRTVAVSFPQGWRAPGFGALTASIHVVSRKGTGAATADAAWTYTSSAGSTSWKGEQTIETLNHTAAMGPLTVTGDGTAALPPAARAQASGDAASGRWTLTHSFTGGSPATSSIALSFRLTDDVTPDWTAFSRKDVTLALSDGSAVPDGWTAAWDEATRTVTVSMPAAWEAPDGVTLSTSVDVTSAVGRHEATSDAVWSYESVADGTRSRLTMDPLTIGRDAALTATLPATGGLMGAVGFAAVMLALAALLARRRARAALHV